MKRYVVVLLLLSLFALFDADALLAQRGQSLFTINAGYINPKDVKSGLMAGVSMSAVIDKAVDIGIGVDFYHKNYSEGQEVLVEEQEGLTTKTTFTTIDYSRTILPVSLLINVKIPLARDYFGYFISGSLNYSWLISKEKNYEQDISEKRKFAGLGWKGAAGIFYKVGERSTILANVFYNSAEVTRDVGQSEKGLPFTERVDLSGLGFRLGVAIDMR